MILPCFKSFYTLALFLSLVLSILINVNVSQTRLSFRDIEGSSLTGLSLPRRD